MEIETTENNINELISRIDARYGKMSKGQKRLADYVKGNYDKAVFLTAAKLGEIVGVSEIYCRPVCHAAWIQRIPRISKSTGRACPQ